MATLKKLDNATQYVRTLTPTWSTKPDGKTYATLPIGSVEAANAGAVVPKDTAIVTDPETGGRMLNSVAMIPILAAAVKETADALDEVKKAAAAAAAQPATQPATQPAQPAPLTTADVQTLINTRVAPLEQKINLLMEMFKSVMV